MTGLALAVCAGLGVHLLWTAAHGQRRLVRWMPVTGTGPALRSWLDRAGLEGVSVAEFAGVAGLLAVVGAVVAFAVFGGLVPAVAVGAFAATFPAASYRRRLAARLERAQDAWPRMIEEIRIRTGSLGRSVPQALFEVGRRAPEELRPAFEAAHREWLLSTDFARTLRILKHRLADPTADAACETLLVAHELGGADLDRRLATLAEDRLADTQGRKDARSKQAGARFARAFVLVVPFGMALAGMSVGDGRRAYSEPLGQALVVIAIAMTAACWWWAGRIMRLPVQRRVLVE